MTDNDIIKTLEGMINKYHSEFSATVLAFINRQKAKIERLQKETDLVSIQFQDLQERINDIKAKAYKEFARRLKCGVPQETGVIRCSDVDKLLKEMVSEKE